MVLRPGPDDLPDFAKNFKVEIVARRDDGGVLASAKRSQLDLEADREIPRYAEAAEKQPGWRFDVIVLGPESQPVPDKEDAKEPSEEDVHRALAEAERMLEGGVRPAGVHRRLGDFRNCYAKEAAGRRGRGWLGIISAARCSTNSTRAV